MEGQTGTRNETYDVVAVLYHALQGVENCQRYERDAQSDQQMSQFFRQAGELQRQLADQAKQVLQHCLSREQGGEGGGQQGGSAFSFGQQGSDRIGGQSMGRSETGSTGMGSEDEMAGGQSGGMGGSESRSGGY
jgi:hypothetical protein